MQIFDRRSTRNHDKHFSFLSYSALASTQPEPERPHKSASTLDGKRYPVYVYGGI